MRRLRRVGWNEVRRDGAARIVYMCYAGTGDSRSKSKMQSDGKVHETNAVKERNVKAQSKRAVAGPRVSTWLRRVES